MSLSSKELCFLSISHLGNLIRKREVSPVEVIDAHLSRIEYLEPTLNSFITVLPDQAIAAAKKAEKDIQAGRYLGPVHGIPFGLKDIFYVKGVRNTSGSKIFDSFIPDFDSTVAARLKRAGAILLGKLNLSPFALGPTGENSDFGNMHNPWSPSFIAGGSSGGSASAAASGQCTFTMGSDTGGSTRVPSALCNLVGFKPTYGLLSKYGVTVLSWNLDHIGPITRTVEDAALVMNAIAGYDSKDPTSIHVSVSDFSKALTGDIKGLRIGVPKEYFEAPIDPQVKESILRAIKRLEEQDAVVSEVSWPLYRYATPIATIIQASEATAYHIKMIKDHGSEIYPPVRLRLETGLFISAKDYIQAQRGRALFFRQSVDLMKKVDLLVGPTVPVTAFEIGPDHLRIGNENISALSLLPQYTRPFNLNGFPAITVPCGFSDAGLPIGLQIAGPPLGEEKVLRVAHAYEQATEWHRRKPAL